MKKYFSLGLFILFIIFLFRSFFTTQSIIGGDWPYFSLEQLRNFPFLPYAWNPLSGLGVREITPWIDSYLYPVIYTFVGKINLPWNIVELFSFFYMTIILSIISSFLLFKKIFGKENLLASFLYASNTYVLLLIGGGQMGVVLAYAIAPWVVKCFLDLKDSIFEKEKKYAAWYATSILSIILATQILFDIRITYTTLFALFVFFLFTLFISNTSVSKKYNLEFFFFGLVLPSLVSVFLHASWVFPILMSKSTPVQQLDPIYTSVDAVRFFSFAKFENALGLLHPNWPENIFGKVGFMKPEFLVLPILAFSSLLFIKTKKPTEDEGKENRFILYFTLLGLIGVFLAKGANDPFGGIYLWMFDHFPGFIMFRDPTKWYLLIVLSHSMLIPFSVGKIYEFFKNKFTKQKFISSAFLIIAIAYLLFLIRPALLGELTGTFQKHTVPQEYGKFEKFLNNEKQFSRTFWIPTTQRFGFYSPIHPAISAYNFFHVASPSGVMDFLSRPDVESELRESSVKYVVIPFDSEGEIFLKDRKYDSATYEKTVTDVQKIPWLSEVPGFGRIHIFELQKPRDHFWSPTNPTIVSSGMKSPTEYLVNLKDAKRGDILVFAEGYDNYWQLISGNTIISSTKYNRFNGFVLPKDGTYSVTIAYKPQEWVNIGLWISGITLASLVIFLVRTWPQGKKNGRIGT